MAEKRCLVAEEKEMKRLAKAEKEMKRLERDKKTEQEERVKEERRLAREEKEAEKERKAEAKRSSLSSSYEISRLISNLDSFHTKPAFAAAAVALLISNNKKPVKVKEVRISLMMT